MSVPGLVVMRELGVCQHYSDVFEPNCPDQADTSVRFVIGAPLRRMLRCDSPRFHALLQALLIHRLLPHGFTNRELRTLTAPLLDKRFEGIAAGQVTYDRRLHVHRLIERIPRSRHYRVTDTGLHHALLFTLAHDHLLSTGLAQISDPSPPRPTALRKAARAYQIAFNDLAHQAALAA